MENLYFTIEYEHQHSYFLCTVFIKMYFSNNKAQWEFRQLTLTPFYLEDKTEVKVDYLRTIEVYHGTFYIF